jgi:hypothetical protein
VAYAVKYRTEYNRRGGSLTTIDILENSYAGALTLLKPDGIPLEIAWSGDVNNIYLPTNGTGATIKVFATPLTMMDLMTSDPQKFMVIVYDGVSGGTVRWQGFVSADIYGENYSYATTILIPITIQCTDGISLLDNIKYTQSDGTFYYGINTLMGVFAFCLSKLALTFQSLYTNNDSFVDSTENELLNGIELFQQNFIDESGNPMSCRQVLDSIIGGLGLTMLIIGPDVYLLDPINLHDSSKGWKYTDAASSIGGYKDISLKDIIWGETDSQLDIVPNFPEAFVRYDPYNFYEETYQFSNSKNWTVEGTFVAQTGYQLNSTVEYEGWSFSPADTMSIASRNTTLSPAEYMLQLNGSENIATYTFSNAVVSEDTHLVLKLSFQVFTQTKRGDANIFDAGLSKTVNRVKIPVSISIGGQFWKFNTDWDTIDDSTKWQELWVVASDLQADYLTDTINDKWVTGYVDAPLWYGDGTPLLGDVTIQIYDEFTSTFADPILPAAEDFFTSVVTQTSSLSDAGVTFTRISDITIRVTIVNLKTHLGLGGGDTLLDNAVTIITGTNGSVPIGGTYANAINTPIGYGSTFANTTFTIISYTASTDTLIYDVYTGGAAYFAGDFDHFLTGYLTDINYTFGYRSVLVFVKDIKLEIVDSLTRANIGNPGSQVKGILSTNLTGKSAFEIQTTCGTGLNGASRGSFKSVLNDGENITGINRNGESVYGTEKLILQNIVSQYKDARFKISGVLDTVGQPINLRTFLIKDSTWLGSKAFYIVSGLYQDQDELLSVEMTEIEDTREDINDLDNPLA